MGVPDAVQHERANSGKTAHDRACARGAPLIRDRHRSERSLVSSAPRTLAPHFNDKTRAALRRARDTGV
jgi:hypothetical protein